MPTISVKLKISNKIMQDILKDNNVEVESVIKEDYKLNVHVMVDGLKKICADYGTTMYKLAKYSGIQLSSFVSFNRGFSLRNGKKTIIRMEEKKWNSLMKSLEEMKNK